MSFYEEYREKAKKFADDHQDVVDKVVASKETPQNILWQKEMASSFEEKEPEAKCRRIKEDFYFTERMVNNLMHFAFLMGSRRFDEKSYQKGWEDREDSFKDALKNSK